MKNKKSFLLFLFAIIICVFAALPVSAASKQAQIFYAYSEQDVVILFSFDKEVVDITFISPSGDKYTKADTEKIDYAQGELWATYRVKSAEQGQWYVEYDLKSNSGIDYSIIDENTGIWIQYLDASVQENNSLLVEFEADNDSRKAYYDYTLYAINSSDSNDYSMIARGFTMPNEAYSCSVDISALPSGTYYLRLEAYYYEGDAEIFDSFSSENFVWNNTIEPIAMENFDITIDFTEGISTMDWSDYAKWSDEKYYVTASCGDEVLFNAELEKDTKTMQIAFPKDADSVEFSIKTMINGIWSAKTIRKIDFTKEYLYTPVGAVVGYGSGQIEFRYKTTNPAQIHVNLNGNEGSFPVENGGSLFFDADSDINTVYASFSADEHTTYIIDTEVYLDKYPPTITLIDDIDGKTFYTDSAVILGSVSDAVRLTINQTETELADSTFSYTANLNIGENIFEIEAYDVNNNASKMLVTLYRVPADGKSGAFSATWKTYIPLFAALTASIIIFILCAVFMKKNASTAGKSKHTQVYLILFDIIAGCSDAICIWQFIKRYLFSSSRAFLDFAETSMVNAANYLMLQKVFGIAAAILSILFIILLLMTIIVLKKKKKKEEPA